MSTAFWIPFVLISVLPFAGGGDSKRPLETVARVDLSRYSGTWYEIARLPNRFQNQCVGDVTATYAILDDGEIRVINRCRNQDGETEEVEGRARPKSREDGPSKFEVRFAPAFLSFLPFVWGDYWIIDLAADYTYAVVGEPEREYLWILARAPQMGDSTYQAILGRLQRQEYDVSKLVKTKQGL